MVKMMCNDQLVYKVVIWAFFGINLWTEKVALKKVCYVAEMFDFAACHEMASSTFHVMAFDGNDSGQLRDWTGILAVVHVETVRNVIDILSCVLHHFPYNFKSIYI